MSDSERPASQTRMVDLDAVEQAMRADQDVDLTEAKEGIVDALLGLTVRRCTGEGPEGLIIYGGRPSSKLVSGFLLPRFDETGLEDETSDIRIATMGLDLQLAADGSGEVIVRPEVSVYVRLLPSWEEITNPRHDMALQVQLSREARRMVEDRARVYINERIAALPPADDDAEPEQSRARLERGAQSNSGDAVCFEIFPGSF